MNKYYKIHSYCIQNSIFILRFKIILSCNDLLNSKSRLEIEYDAIILRFACGPPFMALFYCFHSLLDFCIY